MSLHDSDIRVSLDKNLGRIHFAKIEGYKFTGRLTSVKNDRLTFVRKNGDVLIINFDDLLSLVPLGDE